MTALSRVRTAFSGFPGGPGVATIYALDTSTMMDSLFTFWSALSEIFPTDVTIQVESGGDVIEDTTGVITSAWSEVPQDPVGGGSGTIYAAPVGAHIRWQTDTIADGRRVRGRTFCVPLSSNVFTTTGNLTGTCQTLLRETAADFVSAQGSSFVIWHRPYAGRPAGGGKKAKEAHAGGHALVTGSSVNSLATVLRSRRD